MKDLQGFGTNIHRTIYVLSCITIFLFGILYFRYDNYLYTLSELRQHKALSFCTELKTRIESYEGYDVRNKIVFVNEENMTDPADDDIDARYDYPKTNPYSYYFVNGHLSLYLKDWLGYEPSYGSAEDFEKLDEVKDMPSYPNANSIKKIADTIVVKF